MQNKQLTKHVCKDHSKCICSIRLQRLIEKLTVLESKFTQIAPHCIIDEDACVIFLTSTHSNINDIARYW